MYCGFSYGRRVLSSGSIENCLNPLLRKYFIITGHIADDLYESDRGKKAKKDRMTITI